MTHGTFFVTLGELFKETGKTKKDDEILECLKTYAQMLLPEGWTKWKVKRLTKEEIFGISIDRQIVNQLKFALPIDQIARAFLPSTRLLKLGFHDMKIKMLDWAFIRALIISPPAICNKIRGSAAATELFNNAVRWKRPIAITELSEPKTMKRRLSPDPEARSANWVANSNRIRINALEQRMNNMFFTIMDKINSIPVSHSQAQDSSIEENVASGEKNNRFAQSGLVSPDDRQAPPIDLDTVKRNWPKFDYLPVIKKKIAKPALSDFTNSTNIACKKFGSVAFNRIKYKDARKRLYASSAFRALKINTELSDLDAMQTPETRILSNYDGVLSAIAHGLLIQRKVLTQEVKNLALKFPETSEDLRNFLSEGSNFKTASDDLLQYVYGQRIGTVSLRRRTFRARNNALSSMLLEIPPSTTHLFQEDMLSNFIEDNGGVTHIFPSRFGRFPDQDISTFQQPRQCHYSDDQVPDISD